jgi:hypothetical protein
MATAEYLELARTLPRDVFVAGHAGHFLVKRPRGGAEVEEQPAGFSIATAAAHVDVDPYAGEWQVFPVVKRPGNPFPEQITVGRATNCDIVLRVPSVSKVHVHILREASGAFSLHDNRPSNPILLNGVRLPAGETRPLEIGDCIRFGTLEFEFVDAARLYDMVRTEAQ